MPASPPDVCMLHHFGLSSFRAFVIQLLFAAVLSSGSSGAIAQEEPRGKGLAQSNKERLVLDDMKDVSGWYNGSPVESTISASTAHVKQGEHALKFANVVDYTKGEKNYPVGWPRTGKDLAKAKLTDWSEYDFFECWIYCETSRESLPSTPLSVGFYHSGPKRSESVPLKEVKKDAWVKIVIPIDRLTEPRDVQRVQFNISEADYKHGDRVDFYIDDMVLTRFVAPVVAELAMERKIMFASDAAVTGLYKLAGRKGIEDVAAEFAIGPAGGDATAKINVKPRRQGELSLPIRRPLVPGNYWARLSLRDATGKLVDQKQAEFRVIAGPFD